MEYSEVIKSIGYDQHEILYNIMQMHNGGKPFDCDMTYSIGNFYGKFNVKDSNGEIKYLYIRSLKTNKMVTILADDNLELILHNNPEPQKKEPFSITPSHNIRL